MTRTLYALLVVGSIACFPAAGFAGGGITIRIGPAWSSYFPSSGTARIHYRDTRSHVHHHRHQHRRLAYGPVYWLPPRVVVAPPLYRYRRDHGSRHHRHGRHGRHGGRYPY